jgi:hypothetical protein
VITSCNHNAVFTILTPMPLTPLSERGEWRNGSLPPFAKGGKGGFHYPRAFQGVCVPERTATVFGKRTTKHSVS